MVALFGLRVFPELPRAGTVRWPPMLWTGEGETLCYFRFQLFFFLVVIVVRLQVMVAVGFCRSCGVVAVQVFYVEVLLKVTVDVIVAVNVSKKMLVLFKMGDSHSWTPTLII